MRMNCSGRINLLLIAAIVIVAGMSVLFLSAGETPSSTVGRFMMALATDNEETLTNLSYMGDQPVEQTRKEWAETMKSTKNFLFAWRVVSDTENGNNAVVKLKFAKDARSKMAYEDDLEIPLVKIQGKWKVDVRQIQRDMYPNLPR
jgi:hypothetical protein